MWWNRAAENVCSSSFVIKKSKKFTEKNELFKKKILLIEKNYIYKNKNSTYDMIWYDIWHDIYLILWKKLKKRRTKKNENKSCYINDLGCLCWNFRIE